MVSGDSRVLAQNVIVFGRFVSNGPVDDLSMPSLRPLFVLWMARPHSLGFDFLFTLFIIHQ
jgi:hypothetical protein